MKWLFGFLLLLSIMFFAFMQWGGALTGAARNSLPTAELNPEKIKLLDVPAARQTPASAALDVPQAVAISAAVAVSAPAPIAASAPLAVSAPLPASANLPVSAAVAAPLAKTAAKSCMEWGEFSGADLTRAAKSLSELKLGDHLARRTVEYASGYWVYIPQLKNQAAVNRKIEQIKAIGVEDYFVVQEPPLWVNVISLGVFKTQEAAKNFLAGLKKKGVRTAKVGERKHKLKFTVFTLENINSEGAAQLLALQKDFSSSELKTVACK